MPKDLLSDDLLADDSEKDDMTLLNEILNAPSKAGEDDFSREWQAVFGHTALGTGTTLTPGEPDQSKSPSGFMPSDLLDLNQQMGDLNMNASGMLFTSKRQLFHYHNDWSQKNYHLMQILF